MHSRLGAKTRGASRHLANAEDIEAIWAHRSGSEALGAKRCGPATADAPAGPGGWGCAPRSSGSTNSSLGVGFLRQCKKALAPIHGDESMEPPRIGEVLSSLPLPVHCGSAGVDNDVDVLSSRND